MSTNGKRDDFTREDLITVGEIISLNRPEHIIDEVLAAVAQWPTFAKDAGVNGKMIKEIAGNQRLMWACFV
jgi:serine/threonine-protein kinase HipA